jgi:hypothetical protein
MCGEDADDRQTGCGLRCGEVRTYALLGCGRVGCLRDLGAGILGSVVLRSLFGSWWVLGGLVNGLRVDDCGTEGREDDLVGRVGCAGHMTRSPDLEYRILNARFWAVWGSSWEYNAFSD